ncbi:MAG: orotate phosphoribosyltransferase [Verrucomicrobia bacterium]|nr:orotate phosphoribosyltransferase [Verrucomicrobiota bacterium]
MQDALPSLLATRKGHFRLESGHHSDLWLDLELLCLHPERVQRLAVELSQRLSGHSVEVVCGPLVEGAFVALLVASAMEVEFVYAERFAAAQNHALFAVRYRLPDALRARVRGKRVAIVNDVINAGSAVRGTFADLIECGAQPVAIGALLVLGTSASSFAADKKVALESLAQQPNVLWRPEECPLCLSGVPLDNPHAFT